MVTIRIIDHVNHGYTNADGDVIKDLILKELNTGQQVLLSFAEIDSVSSSFLNSALIDLLDHYSFDFIKSNLGFKDSSKAINDAIRRRFSFEVSKKKDLIEV
ncbi:STAS-like domain-containing protein [Paenibacillus brevis]|uniref:STAS-like domain-containing protein n=1 Tax=Paenibacillus brevis TaxID=2841508 RepID=A0ABS6FSR6_9BACL|nr:STAS-like domain-containing protein [Paenibacillus brevis]MBU5673268.1 STAS-like domain-containing protein [Paenibacillus brevis]